jgi:hypothetical protein
MTRHLDGSEESCREIGESTTFTQEHAVELVQSLKKKVGAALLDIGGDHPHFKPLCYVKGGLMTLEKFVRGEEMTFSVMDLKGPEAESGK